MDRIQIQYTMDLVLDFNNPYWRNIMSFSGTSDRW